MEVLLGHLFHVYAHTMKTMHLLLIAHTGCGTCGISTKQHHNVMQTQVTAFMLMVMSFHLKHYRTLGCTNLERLLIIVYAN